MSSVVLWAWETLGFAGLCPRDFDRADGVAPGDTHFPQELQLTLVTGSLGQSSLSPAAHRPGGRENRGDPRRGTGTLTLQEFSLAL